MRIYRLVIVLVFIAVSAVFAWSVYDYNKDRDDTIPKITVEDSVLEVNIGATTEDFLQGVTAYDEKDGDLTDQVIVESISRFTDIEKATCKITYAVCDRDKHVASVTRKMQYIGYEKPFFVISRGLCFSTSENISLRESIGAYDCIDGNISSKVVITSSSFSERNPGNYMINLSVTNSMGDSISTEIPLVVEERNSNCPSIELSEYYITIPVGEKFNPKKYLVSALDAMEEDVSDSVKIDSEVNVNQEDVYKVNYYATDSLGRTGHNILIVVVGK